MATTALTAGMFEQAVTGDGIVLVDFWASWGGPCRMFDVRPHVATAATKYA